MEKRAYINEDGTVKAEIIAQQKSALEHSAQMRGVDGSDIDGLLAQVDELGYVIIPDLISPDVIAQIKTEAAPLLTHDGRNEFEGHKKYLSYRPSKITY